MPIVLRRLCVKQNWVSVAQRVVEATRGPVTLVVTMVFLHRTMDHLTKGLRMLVLLTMVFPMKDRRMLVLLTTAFPMKDRRMLVLLTTAFPMKDLRMMAFPMMVQAMKDQLNSLTVSRIPIAAARIAHPIQ
jgi:hypothetical protein